MSNPRQSTITTEVRGPTPTVASLPRDRRASLPYKFSVVRNTDSELTCKVCKEPFVKPVMCMPCEHVYCVDCLPEGECVICNRRIEHTAMPHRVIRDRAEAVEVECQDCGKVVRRSESYSHHCVKPIQTSRPAAVVPQPSSVANNPQQPERTLNGPQPAAEMSSIVTTLVTVPDSELLERLHDAEDPFPLDDMPHLCLSKDCKGRQNKTVRYGCAVETCDCSGRRKVVGPGHEGHTGHEWRLSCETCNFTEVNMQFAIAGSQWLSWTTVPCPSANRDDQKTKCDPAVLRFQGCDHSECITHLRMVLSRWARDLSVETAPRLLRPTFTGDAGALWKLDNWAVACPACDVLGRFGTRAGWIPLQFVVRLLGPDILRDKFRKIDAMLQETKPRYCGTCAEFFSNDRTTCPSCRQAPSNITEPSSLQALPLQGKAELCAPMLKAVVRVQCGKCRATLPIPNCWREAGLEYVDSPEDLFGHRHDIPCFSCGKLACAICGVVDGECNATLHDAHLAASRLEPFRSVLISNAERVYVHRLLWAVDRFILQPWSIKGQSTLALEAESSCLREILAQLLPRKRLEELTEAINKYNGDANLSKRWAGWIPFMPTTPSPKPHLLTAA